jgi:hypothetical protein
MPAANVHVTRTKMKIQLQWTSISKPKRRPIRKVPANGHSFARVCQMSVGSANETVKRNFGWDVKRRS